MAAQYFPRSKERKDPEGLCSSAWQANYSNQWARPGYQVCQVLRLGEAMDWSRDGHSRGRDEMVD